MICIPLQGHAEEGVDCSKSSAKALNKAAQPYKDAIQKAATRYDVKQSLIKAVMAGGSCFDQTKVSSTGAIGLMQLTPATAMRFGAFDMSDQDANIDAGTRYLRYLMDRYQGSIAEVLAAYRADEGWKGPKETIHSNFVDIQEPVATTLDILLKLANNKKANRQAKTLLKTWEESAESYQHALLALPPTPAQKALAAWYQSRLVKVHYARTPDARSCGGFSSKTLNNKAAPYDAIIKQAAKRHGVSPALIKSVIAAESCYREMVVSPKGASGLMQLMPETAAELGVLDIFDPEENINAGTRYLSWLIRYYGGSVTHAIAAYNAGAGRIPQGAPVTISFTETRGYINTVLTHLTKLESSKQSAQQAQLMLADWKQAELEYQAALRGETLAVAPEETPAEATTPGKDAQPTAQTEQQPEVVLAAWRNAQAAAAAPTQAIPEAQAANVQLIPASAAQDDIVRVKRISTAVANLPTAETPSTAQTPAAVQTAMAPPEQIPAESLPPAQAPVETAIPMVEQQPAPTTGLLDCSTMPASLLAQTQQQGSGRYAAFFYPVQPGETLGSIAQKLDVNLQDIIQLSSLQPGSLPRPGSLLRVAECSRTLDKTAH